MNPQTEVSCMSIPDGLKKDKPGYYFSIENVMEKMLPIHLERIISSVNEDGRVVCVVVDLLTSSAVEVARQCGVTAAGFWQAMLATYSLIDAIPEMIKTVCISDTGSPQNLERARFLPNQPMLSTQNLPWLIGTPTARKSRFMFWTRTSERTRNLKWLLVNSFPEEYIHFKQLKEASPCPAKVLHIGPLNKYAITQNPSVWEEDMSFMEWLDKQKQNSVVYIWFGSWVSPIGEAKVKSLALTQENEIEGT